MGFEGLVIAQGRDVNVLFCCNFQHGLTVLNFHILSIELNGESLF
jgi:hypothetical protein